MSSSLFWYEPFYDMDRFFDALSRTGTSTANQLIRRDDDQAVRSIKPRMDLHEDTQNNQVTATFELPGLKKDDVNIDLHNGRLSVSAETKISEAREEEGYAVRERRFGKLARTLQLPQGVKEEEIKASMDNGVLTVTFPRSAPELASKRIAVA